MEHDLTQHFYFKWHADVWIVRDALTHHSAEVEDVDGVPTGERVRHNTLIAVEGFTFAKCANNDVATVQLGHPAMYILKRVVGGLVVQYAPGNH